MRNVTEWRQNNTHLRYVYEDCLILSFSFVVLIQLLAFLVYHSCLSFRFLFHVLFTSYSRFLFVFLLRRQKQIEQMSGSQFSVRFEFFSTLLYLHVLPCALVYSGVIQL